MISAKNEYETVPAFTTVAGCNIGEQSNRETAVELIRALEMVSQVCTKQYWKDLAEMDDEDLQGVEELHRELVEELNDHMPMPALCSIVLLNNEWTVTPTTDFADDDEVIQVQEVPEEFVGQLVYTVNDHGNISCYQWKLRDGGVPYDRYVLIWAVV